MNRKNMKQFHQNQVDVSAKTGKKGRKLKKNHSAEACKCLTPFVKLHWWDCPEVNKPCPIHGNVLYQNVKPEKVETDQNVTISFHPSSRTEKLFEPVKSILAQCDPETKINLQYFSPKSFTDNKNFKNEFIQTSFEDLRKNASSNIFVEKKSSIYEKANKMKKLRECFHSPCNSITQKYPSPTPVRRNFNEIEEPIQPVKNFFCGDMTCDQNSEWFSANPFGFKKLEKLTADKRDSDFITVTQHDKDNVINHKIFEIDHRKGLNENPLIGFGKQPTQFAYSSFNVNYPNDTRKSYMYSKTEISKNPEEVRKQNTNSRNSQLSVSSAGSVYVTPFFLMPPEYELSDNDSFEECIEGGKRSVGVQVKEAGECECEERPKLITKYVQISAFESSDSASEQKMNTVSLQTDDPLNRKKYSNSVGSHETSEETLSEKFSYNEKLVQTNIHDNIRIDKSKIKRADFKTTEVQTSSRYQVKEVLITRYNKLTKEAGNQVENPGVELQEGDSSTMNKSLMTQPSFSNKRTQISTYLDFERNTQTEEEERMNNKYDSESESERRKDEKKPEWNAIQSSASKSPERRNMQDARTFQEGGTSPVSDLSELKRMISEFFEKATCSCREREYESGKKLRINIETMTENPKNIDKTPKKENMVNREIQTAETNPKNKPVDAEPTQLDGGAKYRQSVLIDDTSHAKTNYVCSFCGRNINKYSANASTSTEDVFAVKEKTTIIETDCTEITKIKKSSDPKNLSKKSVTTSTKQTVRPVNYYATDSQKLMKTVQAHTSSTKSNIPVLAPAAPTPPKASERSSRSFANRDLEDCLVPDPCNHIRAKPSSQNEKREVSQPYKQCHCNEMLLITQESKYSPRSGMNYSSQRSNKAEDDSSQSRYYDDSKDKKESQKQPNRHFYHVTVHPSWPKDLTNSWKPQEITEEFLKRNSSQKTDFEKEGQCNETISMKNFDEFEETQLEISDYERQSFKEKYKKIEGLKKKSFSFARMPSSSASQIPMNKNSHQSKIIKSEESVKALTHQIASSQMKLFKEDINDLFTVKSCHLNPITIAYDGESSDKLYACNTCKSLILLKGNKNDVSYVPGSNDQLQNQNILSESEEKISIDDIPERQMHEKYSLLHDNVEEQEEEYAEKRSNYSDGSNRTMENEFSKERNTDSEN